MGRAAVAPRVERPVHAAPAPMPASGDGWADKLAALWTWLARPPVAAGFAGVMVATLVGLMWWGRSPEEMQPPQEAPVAAAPATATETAAAPPVATAALPDAARQAAKASARVAAAAPAAEPPARKTAAAPTPAPATPAAPPAKAEAPVVVAAAPPAPAPAAPPARNAAAADMAARARESGERRDLPAAKSAAPAGAVAPPQQAEAAVPSALTGRAVGASTALETPALSNLRFEIRRKPEAWTWTRDDGAPRPMDDPTEAWIAQTDRSTRTVWQAGAVGSDTSTTTLRFTRDGVVRAVLRLGPSGMRLTRGGKTESAELSRGQAAALLSSLDALGP
jgi:hypothetical protein